ncbi:MAG: alkaline phosphatase [Nocardioides sp.]|nr:alkaline phosphatase [Nocardioides sp.]
MTFRSRAVAGLCVLPLLMTLLTTPPSAAADRAGATTRVLAISVDALNPTAMTRLGRGALPHLWRLVDEGAATLNARSQYELTTTLPNHTSMLTGRRINARKGGHGVTWNTDRRGTTVQRAAGHGVASVYSVVHAAGGRTAFFGTKSKFSIFKRSWSAGLDRIVLPEGRDLRAVKAARADLLAHHRAFTFLHLGVADRVGHDHGFMSPRYLDAVRRVDALVGKVLAAIDNHEELGDLVVVLTADHGGAGPSHSQVKQLGDIRVPFVAWGPGVEHGDLYAMNPSYENPRRTRPDLVGRQPVRNGDLANLVTDLLGLDPVPGSRFNAAQRLRVLTD